MFRMFRKRKWATWDEFEMKETAIDMLNFMNQTARESIKNHEKNEKL